MGRKKRLGGEKVAMGSEVGGSRERDDWVKELGCEKVGRFSNGVGEIPGTALQRLPRLYDPINCSL